MYVIEIYDVTQEDATLKNRLVFDFFSKMNLLVFLLSLTPFIKIKASYINLFMIQNVHA